MNVSKIYSILNRFLKVKNITGLLALVAFLLSSTYKRMTLQCSFRWCHQWTAWTISALGC